MKILCEKIPRDVLCKNKKNLALIHLVVLDK